MTPNVRNRVLIVDDEEMVLNLLRSWLKRETSYECHFASSGEEALEIFQRHPIDVVLTDVMMEGISGIDLLRKLKELDPGASVIMMSGYSDIDYVITALREGALDFFRKPFEIRTVLDCLRRSLKHLNLEYSRQEAATFLVDETKRFLIPNSVDAVNQVSLDLARSLTDREFADGPTVESIRVAFNEIAINAVEHGNLEINYEEKNQRIEDFENYANFLKERAAQQPYRDRKVAVEFTLGAGGAKFVVRDEGPGFDSSNLPNPTDPENLLTCHGRGILMARIYMDEVRYNEKGNEATLVKHRPESERNG